MVSTDPQDQQGKHWIALWTHDNVCKILDSYALPLEEYKTTDPIIQCLHRYYKYQVHSGKTHYNPSLIKVAAITPLCF